MAFNDGATTLATITVTGSTTAYTTSALSVGAHSITATYTNSTVRVTTAATTQTVNKANTVTELASSSASFTYGQSVTFSSLIDSGGGSRGPIR